MKILYETWVYFCVSCGREAKGWDARVPVELDAAKCGPTECGHCHGRRFRPERKAEAA